LLGADETPGAYSATTARRASAWYAWALRAPDPVIYRLNESRTAEVGRAIIRDFPATLVCDDTAYHALQKQGGALRIAHCWGSRARKFIEPKTPRRSKCNQVLDLIGERSEVDAQLALSSWMADAFDPF
jgi:hypothetical protein